MAIVVVDGFKRQSINIMQAKVGMTLSDDIWAPFGSLVMKKGYMIDDVDRFRDRLKKYDVYEIIVDTGIKPIPIEEVIIENALEDEIQKKKKEREEFKTEFNGVVGEFKSSFHKFLKGEEINPKVIERKLDNTLKIFEENELGIFNLIQGMKDKEDLAYNHSCNMVFIGYAIGKWMNMNEEELKDLSYALMFADIGKIVFPDELLYKRGKLTKDEEKKLKGHVLLSHRMLQKYDFISERSRDAILKHHERMDGSGYPRGLFGDDIPIEASIVAIADIYSALTSKRPYREAMNPLDAIKLMDQEMKSKLDRRIMDVFIRRVGSHFLETKVKLNDGSRGEIVYVNSMNINRPILKFSDSKILNLSNYENRMFRIVEFA